MSQISILYRLQQIDSHLDNARSSLINIERALSDTSLVQTAQQEFTQADTAYQIEAKQLRDIENKVSDVRVKIEQSESSLYSGKIHNPKELQDLQNEIASLKRTIASLEDREFEVMMAVEQAEATLKSLKNALTEAQGKQIEHQAVLNGDRTKLLAQIERLEAERKATAQPVPPTDLALYEQLRNTRKGVAVAKITSRACGACGAMLTAALIQSSQSPGQAIRCPSCGRILYPG
jgi:hypothetical protein